MLKESKVRSISFTILFPVLTNPTTTADSCTLTLRYARVFSEFRGTLSQPFHLPSVYICVVVLGCYQVRNARFVRFLVLIWLRPTWFRVQTSKIVDI